MTRIITSLILVSFNITLYCQTRSEILSFRQQVDTLVSWDSYKNQDNEIQFILTRAFLFYKTNISSQDASHCGFHPSCSVYALESIQKQGLFIGVINFFDRYSRCNSLSPEQYEVYDQTGLRSDPVKNILYQ